VRLTKHASIRLEQRQIGDPQLELALKHGEWNAKGDRLSLGERDLRNLIADRRRLLRSIEWASCCTHDTGTMQSNDGARW